MTPSSSLFSCSADAKRQMQEQGFSLIRGQDFAMPEDILTAFQEIKAHFNQLPRDNYNREANRFRALRRYSLLDYANFLAPRPCEASDYLQSPALNPEAGGLVRHFEPIPDRLTTNPFLHSLILYDFANSTFPESAMHSPIDVGVHLIRMMAEPGKPGVSVPDCLHKDGEPFTWIHLVDRVDVVGGENIIADNEQQILLNTTLEHAMDTIGVVDERVFHQAKRVFVRDGASVGHRDVILIDFSPMVALRSSA